LESNLQGPLKHLAEALHRAIAQSAEVSQALRDVRGAGFQPFLMLEVTVALTRMALDGASLPEVARAIEEAEAAEALADAEEPDVYTIEEEGDPADALDEAELDATEPEVAPAADSAATAPLGMAPGDREFLRAIRIRID
jgi:hypothetical protein